jgi:hypothetical protein
VLEPQLLDHRRATGMGRQDAREQHRLLGGMGAPKHRPDQLRGPEAALVVEPIGQGVGDLLEHVAQRQLLGEGVAQVCLEPLALFQPHLHLARPFLTCVASASRCPGGVASVDLDQNFPGPRS